MINGFIFAVSKIPSKEMKNVWSARLRGLQYGSFGAGRPAVMASFQVDPASLACFSPSSVNVGSANGVQHT